ncbi:MAG TPA: NHLP bacteriocin export ABC transporter permease/ATPase subunit [Crinalium sp.]|jgi:ATP-binding cassette subfamily C protein
MMQIRGNQPLLLNNSHVMWVVQSGALAVFAIRVQNGVVEGDRRYLFTVYPGEALFGVDRDLSEQAGLIAVALEPAEVLSSDLKDAMDDTPTAARSTLLDGWITKLGQIQGWPKPKPGGVTPPMQYVSLMQGQVLQPQADPILWVQILQGQACWMGSSDFPVDKEFGLFPSSTAIWLEAAEQLELSAQPTSAIANTPSLLNGLAHLHAYFLQFLDHIREQEDQDAFLRFHNRQQLNRQVTQQTIRNLASILNPNQNGLLHSETPLLIAAGAVGKALGVTIEPPMQSEDLKRVKEPLEAIARSSHLRLRRVLLRGQWWQKDGGPILAYTRQERRPVALLPIAGSRYELFDPKTVNVDAEVTHARSMEEHKMQSARIAVNMAVADTLDPVAFVFYRPLPDGVLKAIDLLKFAFQGRQRDLLWILVAGVLATLVGMFIPQATAILIDQAIPYGDVGLLTQIGLGLLAAAFGGVSFQLAQAIASMRLETISDASLQAAVWDRLLKLRTSFFRQYAIGDLNSRVSGISAIRRKLSGTALQSIFAGFFALLNLGLLFYYSASLAGLALIVALVVMTFTAASGALLIRKNRPLMELEGDIFGLMVQLINGISKLRIAGAEERAFAYWGQKYTQQLRLTLSTQQIEDTVALFNTVMPTLTSVVLFWLASALVNTPTGGLSTGSFLAFSVAFGTFIGGATSLSNTLIEILGVIPLWQRSQPILTAEPEIDLNKADPGRLNGSIHVDHLTFRYRDDGPLILEDVSIHAQPGEFIALVGPSGSGKSTILRLLLGFDMPISGTVYYDGQDLAGLDVLAVRRQLGVVLQNGRINAGTVFENISGGALIKLDDAWKAAEMSGLADDIRAMPMQMHTLVSEGGSNLSGGQRQRLIIARALALHPRILLLDEATSALDNRTQAIVSQSLDQLNVTRVVIAHRLSTIRNADRIYVLEAGRVVQQGSFDELAHQPGLFAQLIRRQVA